MAVFIDIASTFDRLSPEAAVRAMQRKGIDEYENYLTNRIVIVDIKGIKVTRNLHLGCPQGGVLSVIIWNLVFDRLLRFFDKGRLKCIGYADDACLVIHGPNLNLLYKYMNKGLAKADEWAKDSGL